jgi:photosystem II stability/assembly factor-like uncharacterized protein
MQIALSPGYEQDRVVFVGLRSHGVWKSENSGGDWSRDWLMPVDYVTSLEISSNFINDKTVFAGIRGSGIFISNDAGESWRVVNDGIDFMNSPESNELTNYVNDPPLQRAITDVVLAVSPNFADDQTVLAGTSAGLFKSINGGLNWTAVPVLASVDAVPVRAIEFSPAYRDDGVVFVSLKGHGLFLSSDSANTFAGMGSELLEGNHELRFISVSADFAANKTIFGASDESVLMSTDSGETWAELKRPVRYEDWRGAGEGPVRFSGNWSRESGAEFSASTQTVSDVVGATASLNFSGRQFAWLGERCPDCGLAEVLLDDEVIASIDLYSDERIVEEVLTVSDLENQPHQLQIRVSGEKNALSNGYRVSIDAFDAATR